MWNHFGKRFSGPDGPLGRSNSYDSLAPPGTKACDAEGVALRPEWREGQVRAIRRSAISCGPGRLTSSTFVVQWIASGFAAIGVNLSFIAKGLHRVEPRGAPGREQTRHARHGEQENRNGGIDAGIQGWHSV
jgi:hypothetical protein